jgi:hypothetical protein
MPPPAEHEFTQETDHIYHEIRSLLAGLELPGIIKNLVPNDVYEGTESLVLEARLLHARNSIAFFAEHHHKDNLIARDYGFPYQPLPIKKDEIDRLHNELAHLSRKRGTRTEETKEWHYDDLERPVLTRCEQFVEHLIKNQPTFGAEHPITDWQQLLNELRMLIPQPVTLTSSPPVLTHYTPTGIKETRINLSGE